MICPTNADIKNKLIDAVYNCLSNETKASKNEIASHLNLDNLVRFLEGNNKTKIKFNIKPAKSKVKLNVVPKTSPKKKKLNIKKNWFQKFTDICDKNRIQFYQYNSEFGWTGPAIKIFEEQYDDLYPLFDTIPTECEHGTGFIILHPSVFLSDKNIIYNTISITPENSDDSDDEFETEKWKYDGVEYDLNIQNNNVYCRQTQEFVGKRNEFNVLDRNALESS